MGRRGAFKSEAIACGILLLGPDTEYPAHSHEAEELYLPLAGHALWRSAGPTGGFARRGPGFHHPSWTTHAMRTQREPLLAAYCVARRRPHGEVAHRRVSKKARRMAAADQRREQGGRVLAPRVFRFALEFPVRGRNRKSISLFRLYLPHERIR